MTLSSLISLLFRSSLKVLLCFSRLFMLYCLFLDVLYFFSPDGSPFNLSNFSPCICSYHLVLLCSSVVYVFYFNTSSLASLTHLFLPTRRLGAVAFPSFHDSFSYAFSFSLFVLPQRKLSARFRTVLSLFSSSVYHPCLGFRFWFLRWVFFAAFNLPCFPYFSDSLALCEPEMLFFSLC